MDDDEEIGGESVCYAHYFCDECGVLLDGREHLITCAPLIGQTTPTSTE